MTDKKHTGRMARIRLAALLFMIVGLIYFALLAVLVAADVPAGTITIYGLYSTNYTGSRNVFLNTTYSSPVHGVRDCRWANDLQANLINYAWEPCQTVKAWILSEGYGEKVVWYEIRDYNADTAVYRDNISYIFLQDQTPPIPAIVYDGSSGPDIDWWNSNTTLDAHWFGAEEDISTLFYKYRILNNSVCYGNDCSWTNLDTATSTTVNDLRLEEGNNYTFEILTYNSFGLNASSRSDNVTIDITPPPTPSISSSSHPDQNTPYDAATALFNFTAVDPTSNGASSGIAGFSHLIDTHPGTAPDNRIEDRYWNTLANLHHGNYNQTLKGNSTGRAYAVFSQLHINVSVNESFNVKVALAEQDSDYSDLMGVKVYLISVPDGTDLDSFNMETSAISDIKETYTDIMYVENMLDAWTYEFSLTSNDTADDTVDDVYIVVAGYTDDDNNRKPLAITATTAPALIDSSTRNFVCDETKVGAPPCPENTLTLDYSIEVKREDEGSMWSTQYDYLGDGTYYFHVKAKDNAGNWGAASHYRIIVAAGGVSSLVYSPVDNEVFHSTGDINITVLVSLAGNASVGVIALHPDGSNYTSAQVIANRTAGFTNVTLELGINEIYAVTNVSGGLISHSPHVSVTVSATPMPFTSKSLNITYPTCGSSPMAYMCYVPEGSNYVGIASETLGSVSAPSVGVDTSRNSLKIFMTKAFTMADIEDDFADNVFLDRVNPMFGYKYRTEDYLIQNNLRYYDISLGGSFLVPPGTYQLHLRKGGMTADGKSNITISI